MKQRAVRRAAADDVVEFGGFIGQAAGHRLVACVVADELESGGGDRAVGDGGAHHHANPVAVPAAAMTGVEGETAEAIIDWFPAIHLDRQRIVRTVADHDVGAGIDRGMADLAHIGQHLLVQPPMA